MEAATKTSEGLVASRTDSTGGGVRLPARDRKNTFRRLTHRRPGICR